MSNRKKVTIVLSFLAFIFSFVFSFLYVTIVPVFALPSDLQYQFETRNKEELLERGETNIHFNGAVPEYLLDIYDLTPQKVNTSEYGATIITPNETQANPTTYAPYYAPSGGYQQSPKGLATGTTQGTQTSKYTPNMSGTTASGGTQTQSGTTNTATYPSYFEPDGEGKPQYPITSIEQVRDNDGKIGTIKIPSIDLKVTAYDGDTYAAMNKGIGHISTTSAWSGNCGFVGHNRGSNGYFSKLKKVKVGDEVVYKTKLGTREYVVQSITKIADTDWTKLQYTNDNRLTFITCVEDVPDQRLCVQAVEK